VSEQNVEVVKRVYRAVAEQDVETGVSLTHPDAEFDSIFSDPPGRLYSGHEGLRAWLDDIREAWQRFTPQPTDFIDAGDQVVVPVKLTVEGKGSGIELTNETAYVWTLRDGKLAGGRAFTSLSEALEAAGVER
jgi:ketosteroid isomerase-like protein